jgi:hypothetical protein
MTTLPAWQTTTVRFERIRSDTMRGLAVAGRCSARPMLVKGPVLQRQRARRDPVIHLQPAQGLLDHLGHRRDPEVEVVGEHPDRVVVAEPADG